MSRSERSPDVVVVGAGIVGAACAYFLCRAGLRVCLVERQAPVAGTSGACDGMLLLWDKLPGAELELGKLSVELWRRLGEELAADFELEWNGSVLIAETAETLVGARRLAVEWRGRGVAAEELDQRGLALLEPELAPDLAGGVFFPNDGQVEPRRATVALLAAARRLGLDERYGVTVTAIERSASGAVAGVRLGEDRIVAPWVVLACGVWTGELAASVGAPVPVQPRKGHVLVTDKAPGLVRHPMLEGGYTATVQSEAAALQHAFVAEGARSGSVLIGASRQLVGFDRRTDPAVAVALARRAIRFLPRLQEHSVVRVYAGLRPFSPDHLPIIGPCPEVSGLIVSTGHEGAGIVLAPATGQLVVEWVAGQLRSLPDEWFSPGRFGIAG